MITHYLGREQVKAYSRDLVARLLKLGQDFPRFWFPLGTSGWKMHIQILRDLHALAPDRVLAIEVAKADYARETKAVSFLPDLAGANLGEGTALMIDGAVHSGSSMLALAAALRKAGARRILSYSLVLKSGASFVPTYFGVVIDDKDRTYFDLQAIPNNRLHDSRAMTGVLRLLGDADASVVLDVGAPFEGACVGDLLYDRETKSSQIYGYEEAEGVTGFISFRQAGSALFIDGLGVVPRRRGAGIAPALMRWAESWGRSRRCSGIELWAYEEAKPIYDHYGYAPVSGEWKVLGQGHRFMLMRKPLLYNVKVTGAGEDYRGVAE